MAGELTRIYWDACCFTYYINADPSRLPDLEAILEEAYRSDGKLQILTSTISKVEVAFSLEEALKRQLDPSEEDRINNLWLDSSVVKLVEVHEPIVDRARALVRAAMVNPAGPLGLRAADAIHLATAVHYGVSVFHTYDTKLLSPDYFRITGLPVEQPMASQPMLDLS